MRDYDDRVQLPVVLGPVSNGEFLPEPASAEDIRLAEAVLERAGTAARRLGIDRRRFLQTAGGMAALLGVVDLAACSAGRSRRPGGRYRAPPPEDLQGCESSLGSHGEFIMDVHTHHVMPSLPWRRTAPGTLQQVMELVPPDCTASNPLNCLDRSAYLHDVFLASDTTVALLSDLPSKGASTDILPFADAEGTQEMVDALTRGGSSRLLLQNVLAPNFGPLGASLEEMTRNAETGKVSTFKVYTAWGPDRQGFSLDDPAIGLPVVQHAHDLGVKVFCGHKGLPLLNFQSYWDQPQDMVAVSRIFPDMQFVVYHSAWTPYHVEGPYNPEDPVGVDSLLLALDAYEVPPDGNVWADVAAMWRSLLVKPDQAAHAIGKLLKRLGTHRLLWGTDSVFYGPPQTQIMAFRAFHISPEYQDRYGYPELTDAVKDQVLGLNAAELFGLDPDATRCVLTADMLEANRPVQRELAATGELPPPWVPRGPVSRGQMLWWLAHEKGPWIPT